MENKEPLLLLYSSNRKIRRIIAAGLGQHPFRITESSSIYTAALKANQYQPSIIILDIASSFKDFLIINSLQSAHRTKNIPIIIMVSQRNFFCINSNPKGRKILANIVPDFLQIIKYPFNFANLLSGIEKILTIKGLNIYSRREGLQKTVTLEKIIFDPCIEKKQKLKSIHKQLNRNWVFPFTLQKAIEIAEKKDSSTQDLSMCIRTDPSATSGIIRIANTIHYTPSNGRIKTAHDAIVRIGFRETRNLLISMAIINLFPETNRNYFGFSRKEFWLHSLATGLIAEKLWINNGWAKPGVAFVAGLMHDLGKIPLDNDFKNIFPKILEETTNNITPFYENEKNLITLTHADLAAYLMEKWNFQKAIIDAVKNHHDPEKILVAKNSFSRGVQEAVYVANIFAKMLEIGHSCDQFIEEIPEQILNNLKISKGPDDNFFESIINDLSNLCRYLNMYLKDFDIGNNTLKENQENIPQIKMFLGKNTSFHPLYLALKSKGYQVILQGQFSPQDEKDNEVWISIPDAEQPFNLTLDEGGRQENKGPLKIFLLNDVLSQNKTFLEGDMDSNLIFLNRKNLDLRLIISIISNYMEKNRIWKSESLSEDVYPSTSEFSNLKVMIVDDSVTALRKLKRSLVDAGFQHIIEAKNGIEAMEELEKNQSIDLILSDWVMPKMSGLELLNKIRNHSEIGLREKPFFMVTSSREKKEIKEALSAGANGYLLKPFDSLEIIQRIYKLFELK